MGRGSEDRESLWGFRVPERGERSPRLSWTRTSMGILRRRISASKYYNI